jgi:hypothetical protein
MKRFLMLMMWALVFALHMAAQAPPDATEARLGYVNFGAGWVPWNAIEIGGVAPGYPLRGVLLYCQSGSSTGPCAPASAAIQATNIADYGALTTNADNSTAITNAATAAAAVGGCVTAPNGVFKITSAVTFAANASLCLQPGTTIRSMAAMAAVLQTPLSTRSTPRTTFSGGTIDGNGFAVDGVFIQYGINVHFQNITITQATTHGIHVGNQSAPGTTVQVYVDKGVWVNTGSITPVAGSSGIFFDRATDCGVDFSLIGNGYPIGEIATSGNIVLNGHVWNGTSTPLQTAFELLGARDSLGDGWYADTALANGVVISGANVAVNQGTCFMNSSGGNDNIANCINVTAANLNPAITNVVVNGSSASFRYAKDIAASSLTGISVSNLQDSNVVTPVCGAGTTTCNIAPKLAIGSGQTMSTAPEMTMLIGGNNVNTLNNVTGNPFVPINPITIQRVDVQMGSLGVGCTTFPVLTMTVGGVTTSLVITLTNINSTFINSYAFSQAVAGSTTAGIQMKVTTAAAGCTTPPSAASSITLHYVMQ